ncbi:putative reverse transcriptase domain-containing protein [Tanacetum coccineum]
MLASSHYQNVSKQTTRAPKPVNATTEFVDDMDFAYIPTDGPATVEMVNATKDNFDVDDLVKFQELLLGQQRAIYEGCPTSQVSAMVKQTQLKNDKDLTACQTCGTSRWKVDNKDKESVRQNIPHKNSATGSGKTKEWIEISLDLADKEMILQELDKMQAELVVTLCLLEKFFPSSFFDIMIHLTMHLTRETPPKTYKDTYDEVDEEFSTVIHHRNDNVLPRVDRRDLANESRDDYYRKGTVDGLWITTPYSTARHSSAANAFTVIVV